MILKKTIYLNDEKIFIGEEDFIVANLTLYPVTAEQSGSGHPHRGRVGTEKARILAVTGAENGIAWGC